MNRLKQDVLDSCEVGLAGKRVLEQTIENLKDDCASGQHVAKHGFRTTTASAEQALLGCCEMSS